MKTRVADALKNRMCEPTANFRIAGPNLLASEASTRILRDRHSGPLNVTKV